MKLAPIISELKAKLLRESSDSVVELPYYYVSFDTYESSDAEYDGVSLEDAEYEFDSFDDIPRGWEDRTDMSVSLHKKILTYKFIGHEYGDIDDYPIEEYYDYDTIYELVDETEHDIVKTRTIDPINSKAGELLTSVDDYFYRKYGKRKYNKIDVMSPTDDSKIIGCIQLRIADHTENVQNTRWYGCDDGNISVVIADYDPTREKFHRQSKNSSDIRLEYNGDDDFNDIVREIEYYIDQYTRDIINWNDES